MRNLECSLDLEHASGGHGGGGKGANGTVAELFRQRADDLSAFGSNLKANK